jgi:hypothetical protein
MDPTTLAMGVVAMLVPYLQRIAGGTAERLADELGQAAADQLSVLYKQVKMRLFAHRHGASALERLTDRPSSELRQRTLVEVLEELLKDDPAFATELMKQVEAARDALPAAQAQVGDAGATAVGGDVNLRGVNVAGRDLTIGDQRIEGPLQ